MDRVGGEQSVDLVQGAGEGVDELAHPLGPAGRQVRHHAPDARGGGRDAGARQLLVQLVDALALLERVQEGGECSDVDGGGAQPEQMREDAVQLEADHPHHLAPLGDLDAHQLLDRHGVGAVVDQRRQVVHAVGQRHDLVVRAVLAQLLEGGVQVPDMRRDRHHGLSVQLADEPQHAVRGGVLGSDVDEHLLGADVGLRDVDGRQRPHRGPGVHPHLRSPPHRDLHRSARHRPVLPGAEVGDSSAGTIWGAPRPSISSGM